MAMKSMLALLGVLMLPVSGVLAQQAASASPPEVPADIDEWMRTAWGVEPQTLGVTDTHFLSSLSASERQGAFLFKQRCNTCHYSTMSDTRGAGAGLVDAASYGPLLSRTSVDGEDSERAARERIAEGSATMPAFKYALEPEQIDAIIGYLKKVDTLRPPVVDRLLERSATDVTAPVSFSDTTSTLWGTITSATGEALEGVTVSARSPGRNVTTSVFTDSDGEYYFPPLEAGRPYKVWAQAQAFEAGRADVALSQSAARQDFRLTPTTDFQNQLTGAQWYGALPDGTREDRRMKEVFRAACMGCHPQNFTLISRFDEAGWGNIIDVMSRMHPYRYGTPAAAARRQPNAIMVHFRDELAAWLAKVRGPGASPMTFTPRRPTGDSTLMIAREYDSPEPGFGLPFFNDGSTDWALGPVDFMDESKHHAMNATLDRDGNVWMADMFNITRTVVRYDWRTGQATNFALSETPDDPPANSHDIIRDDDGVVWFDMSNIGALGRINPRTGESSIIRPPEGARVGPWIGDDGLGGIWTAGAANDVRAMRYDPGTGEWTLFQNPIPNASNYGMTGDGAGNGWWSTAIPRDGLMKADLETGQATFVPAPDAVNDRSDLFTAEEMAVFADRLTFYGHGRPGAVAIRKPGADPRSTTMWGCSWYGGGLLKLDSRSDLQEMYPFPPEHEDGNCYETSVDEDGMVWLPFTHGDAVAKFDPDTEEWTSYFLPTIGTKTHGLQAVTVDGRTQIGMGYLGAGKVAKLEFRTREELQRLKAETDPPRTAWGVPDLQGTWSLPTMTPLERAAEFEDRLRLTAEEEAEFLARRRSGIRQGLARALSADFELGDGGVDQSIYDHPLLDGRTSLVVSPENGQIPRTEEGRFRVGMPGRRMSGIPEGPEDRALDERCMMGGALPLRGSAFPARIFQTPDHVVIHYEFINATITVPLDDRPPVPTAILQWTGTSRGSWDGDTLVIESTNFDPRWTFAGSGAGMRLVQRLTRIDQDTMHLEYTVTDPESFVQPWTASYPLTNTEEPIYEFACHEGNRSMTLLLNGARATEQIARFVGSFGLESFERVGGTAADGPVFTDGMLSYDASGRVSVQLSSSGSYLAYYGRYDVNVTRKVVEHAVEGGSAPGVRDSTLSHRYELADDGDTLVLSLMGDDDVESRATWQRHR